MVTKKRYNLQIRLLQFTDQNRTAKNIVNGLN